MSDDDKTTKPKRAPLRLPFAFGERVYHVARTEKIVGVVTGFNVRPGEIMVAVTWSDDLREMNHFFFELTTEFSPFTEDL